ncbi:MAG TPA: hypothetical protein VN493_21870 [Thermoanaerobaculia bacterium]|nr:hypothetical protein [Thermoanaerobaculia bacterium]
MNKVALLVAVWLAAAPAHAESGCYQKSDLSMFAEVVEVVAAEQMKDLGCWHLRLRLRGGPADPFGHAMICGGNGCRSGSDLVEGIYWLDRSPRNRNVGQVIRVENRSCTDVSFCVAPADESEVMWVDFVALFEESYFVPPTALRPRWSQGLVGFSSFDGRSHCQDDERRGSICLQQ